MLTEPTSTVADYLAHLNTVLSQQYGRVKGEVTSIKPYPRSIYFTIKDKNEDEPALLNCIIWPNVYEANGIELKVGDEIIVTGAPDIYPSSGRLSFKTSTIEYAGEGTLKKAYEKLKATLGAEGLFAPERKRSLPEFPKKVGVITSKSGVVMQDFSANLKQRGYKVSVVDSRVEGKDAIHDLLASIKAMAKQDIEVLIIMRGGGSWESLQAFNTESVVRAVANFKVPVMTGIGHDTDVTLVEMVSDIARSTPTAVAEALNEPWDGIESSIDFLTSKTIGEFRSVLAAQKSAAAATEHNIFRSCERQLSASRSSINDLAGGIAHSFADLARRVRDVNASLLRATGIMRSNILAAQRTLKRLPKKMDQQFQASARRAARSVDVLERAVAVNDPRRNMRLGYSLSYVGGKLARDISSVATGDIVSTKLVDGEFTSEVKKVK